jgi:hypothetical protein
VIAHDVLWGIFLLVAVFVAGGMLFLLLRGERIGTMKLPGRIHLAVASFNVTGSAMHARLTVAREGGASTRVQMRVVLSTAMYMERLAPAEAASIAQLLESAAERLRLPWS